MSKKTLWVIIWLQLALLLVLGILYLMQNRPMSLQGAGRAMDRLDESIQQYTARNGHPPTSLADLHDSSLSAYRGVPIVYINNLTNFELRLSVPSEMKVLIPAKARQEAEEAARQAGIPEGPDKASRGVLIHTGEFKVPLPQNGQGNGS